MRLERKKPSFSAVSRYSGSKIRSLALYPDELRARAGFPVVWRHKAVNWKRNGAETSGTVRHSSVTMPDTIRPATVVAHCAGLTPERLERPYV